MIFITAACFLEFQKLKEMWRRFKHDCYSKDFLWFWILVLILVLSLLNKIFFGHEILCLKDYYSSFYLLPFLIIIGQLVFHQKLFKTIIFLTALECVIAIIEYSIGFRSLIMTFEGNNIISDYSLLYNSRVFGLSVNSSVLAYKVFISLILIDFIQLKRQFNWVFRLILTVGLIFSFSRIIYLLLILYWFITMISYFRIGFKNAIRESSFLFMFLILIANIIFFNTIKNQLTRGAHDAETSFSNTTETTVGIPQKCSDIHALPLKEGTINPSDQGLGDKLLLSAENIQSSGRKKIWLNYINYIEQNFLLGNGSDKLMFRQWLVDYNRFKLVHAHNSFLQLLATNGIIITILYLVLYFSLMKSFNLIPVLIIILYSCLNYGIFWGFSLMDFMLIIFITHSLTRNYDYQRASRAG